MVMKEEDYLAHYGILRRSGRYPWGSGRTPQQRNKMFLDTIEDLKRQGLSEAEIARGFSTKERPFSVSTLRALKSIAVNEQRQERINQVRRLAEEKGLSNVAIGKELGLNESTVRSLRDPSRKDRLDVLQSTANMLERQVGAKNYIDIGTQVEKHVGVSRTQLDTAVAMLREKGYTVHNVKIPQVGTGEMTTLKVLAKPGVKQREVFDNRYAIGSITEHSDDGGRSGSYMAIQPPLSISSKRIAVNYAEDGGNKADGMIYVRPGIKDVSLGKARYAQVRIAVDGTHYLKGMAVYRDDLPAGVDLVFNTNKSNTGSKHDAMKEMKLDDPENPFGAAIKAGGQQLTRDPKTGKVRVTSAMNIINEQGDWDTWSKNLPSQMLSKQHPDLAEGQLNMTSERRRRELTELTSLTNPVIKRKLLETFADETDSAAVDLKAHYMPRQATKVLIPVNSVKESEVYAPSLRHGERVALVRFPHGGTFEIPQVTVNNNNREARKLLGTDITDAIGINHKVAERLSGADFDGDYVLAIPNNRGSVKSTAPLEGLKGFDPKHVYPPHDGMRTVDGGTYNAKTGRVDYPKDQHGNDKKSNAMQQKMGDVSNLITDMTIKGANTQDIARAVRHSMVIIDAEKHSLDYKASYKANGIAALKQKYQGQARAGASTLISRAGSRIDVPKRKPRPASQGGPIDKETGRRVFVPTGEKNAQGDTKTFVSRKLAETHDAHTLVSEPTGTPIERIYADHSNRLKAMANEARKEQVNTKTRPMSQSAKQVYKAEVESLNAKLNLALRNAPLERQAQVIANAIVSQKRQANPNMDKADLKKIKSQALAEARARTGAGKTRLGSKQSPITDREWEGIQAGAISNHMLTQIMQNADTARLRELATPREHLLMTSSKTSRAKSMLARGFTLAEVADQLGVSLSTLKASVEVGDNG